MPAITLNTVGVECFAHTVLNTKGTPACVIQGIYNAVVRRVPKFDKNEFQVIPLGNGECEFRFDINPHAPRDTFSKMIAMWSELIQLCPDLSIDATMHQQECGTH